MSESDDQQLFNLQSRLKNGDAQAMAEMYEKLVTIAYKIINSRNNSNAKIKALSADERKQKAHDAATYLIEQYLKRPDFVIKKNMTGYLYKRVQFELYGKNTRQCDRMLIFYGDVPESKEAKKKFYYIVKDKNTGKIESFESYEEMHLDPRFKTLRKKRFFEGIRYGKTWKNYRFDILEVNE